MASHRQCFYCKQSFRSADFHNHLKQCQTRKRQNKNPPLQPKNQYNNMQPQQSGYQQPSGYQQQQPQSGYRQQPQSGFQQQSGYQQPQSGYRPQPQSGFHQQHQQHQQQQQGPPQQLAMWTCTMCSFQNSNSAQVCTMCQQGQKPQAQQAQSGFPPPPPSNQDNQYWECQSCTFVNSKMSASCKICSQPQPKQKQQPPQPPPHQQFGNPNNKNNINNNGMVGMMKPNNGGMPPPNIGGMPPPNLQKDDEKRLEQVGMQPKNGGMSGTPPPPPQEEQSKLDGGGGGANPDEATLLLIQQMMEAEMCVLCKKQQGFELPCGHNICAPCSKKYILNGIATMKWKKQSLSCPNPSGCKGVIPLWILKECGLGIGMQKKLEEMQNKYMIDADPNLTSCPKCKEIYAKESGDIQAINPNEKGPNGKVLSFAHKQHKAKYRFRCSKEQCKTIFCSGCQVTPYHLGYTCEEYKNYKESKKCRFCEVSLNKENTAPKDFTLKSGLDNVCNSAECLEKRRWSCDLKHQQCGHNCIGLMGHECIECLNPKCLPKNAELTDEEYCNICWVDPLRAAPCVKLNCGHYFHFMCLWQKIDRKWPAARITFGFLNCPLCKQPIHHPALEDITKKYYELKEEIQKDAVERVKIEGLQHDKRLTDPNSRYYKNIEDFSMDRLAFYPCSKCKKPYFGGMKACEEAGLEQAENYKQEHLVCGSCASGPNAKSCKKHGKKYITYKCKFCCSVSSWYCWGSTHFCDKCHKRQEQGDYLNRKPISELPKCPGVDKCPLGVEHPPNGTAEFSLGCVVCLRK